MKKKIEVEIGFVSGRLTVLKEVEPINYMGNKTRMVQCRCECGNIVTKPFHGIKSKNYKSCGCLLKDCHLWQAKGWNFNPQGCNKDLTEPLGEEEYETISIRKIN